MLTLDMNRVEGDLEIKIEIEDGVVTDAWTVGTMFRGFEQILLGRAPKDSLVITPRVCGICGTAHLYCAVSALEMAYNCPIAPNGTRVRNICLMSEEIQSDIRHAFLMFCVDLPNKAYKEKKDYDKVVAMFEAFKGKIVHETVEQTKKILEVIALFGGQWPHASYMVPGGVTCMGSRRTIVKSIGIVDDFTRWYEKSVLGCSLDRWLENKNSVDVEKWLDEKPEHREGALGLFWTFTKGLGFEKLGKGTGNLVSPGNYPDPDKWQPPFKDRTMLRTPGFYNAEAGKLEPFDHMEYNEHVKHSWFKDYDGGKKGVHPWEGETIPSYEADGDKYSWAKAPRYGKHVVELGAFPELCCDEDPLMTSLNAEDGANVFSRQMARIHRPVLALKQIREILLDLDKNNDEPYYLAPTEKEEGQGYGMVCAARGGLGHWVKLKMGVIDRYQIVTPTAFNASPRDSDGNRGHWERSMIGTKIADEANPIEIEHIIRCHDACLVCTVHYVKTGKKKRFEL